MSRHLQQQLLARLDTAVTLLDLPLNRDHIERLAVELTPVFKAMLAEQTAAIEEAEPVPFSVASDADAEDETETTQVEGCLCRIGLDIDLDSPAAVLADRLRSSQPDVTATDVPGPTALGLTVKPQSIECWRWWLHRLNVAINSVRTVDDGSAVTAKGSLKGVTIHLRGDGVPELLTDTTAARLSGVLAGHPW
ncbi:hypothetical protein ACFY3G_02930 [Streptomyces phaeochromogenes]|uniref:hypothetical protein n=1 Tax=Streptomyces phaeochromogenes TaxID=1923 RepID=UPI0036BEA0A7